MAGAGKSERHTARSQSAHCMFESWISSTKPSLIDFSEFALSPPREPSAPRSIPVEFRQGLHFELPKVDLSGEAIYRLLPQGKSAENDPIVELLRENLGQFCGKSHAIEVLLSESAVVGGTCELAASGFVNNPHDLVKTVARRYALLLLIDLDRTLLNRVLDGPTRVRTNRGNDRIWLNPVELPKDSFSVSLQEPLMALCTKPVRFLPFSKVDRGRLKGILREGVSHLDLLQRKTKDGFDALHAAYKAAYRDWMGY